MYMQQHMLERAADRALDLGHDLGATVVYLRDDSGCCMAFPRGDCDDRTWLEPLRATLNFAIGGRHWLDFKRQGADDRIEDHLLTVGLAYDASDFEMRLPLEAVG